MWSGGNRGYGRNPLGPGYGRGYNNNGPWGANNNGPWDPNMGGYNTPWGANFPGQYGMYQTPCDPKTMELMAMREELEFMSYRMNEILTRLDEIEKEK